MKQSYKTFFSMIATSSVLMYVAMYLNNYAWDQIFFSETRMYMTMIMTAIMIVVMFWFMRHMYDSKKMNQLILGGSIALFAAGLFLVRSQVLVDDIDYMEAMIPHHSIAILTSKRAQIEDPRVRELADEIIVAQEREIAEMKALIEELD